MLLRRYHKKEKIVEEAEVEEVKEEIITDGFEKLKVSELRDIAKARGITNYNSLKKQELINELNK